MVAIGATATLVNTNLENDPGIIGTLSLPRYHLITITTITTCLGRLCPLRARDPRKSNPHLPSSTSRMTISYPPKVKSSNMEPVVIVLVVVAIAPTIQSRKTNQQYSIVLAAQAAATAVNLSTSSTKTLSSRSSRRAAKIANYRLLPYRNFNSSSSRLRCPLRHSSNRKAAVTDGNAHPVPAAVPTRKSDGKRIRVVVVVVMLR